MNLHKKAQKITVYQNMVAIDYLLKERLMSAVLFNHNLDLLTWVDMSAVKVDYRQDNPVFDTYIATKYLGIA